MIKKSNLILLVCYSLLFSLPSFAETGNDLLKGAKDILNDKMGTAEASRFIGYVKGSLDVWLAIYRMQDEAEYDRCIPSKVTNWQLCSISAKYIVSHPEKWSDSGSALIPTAVTEAFDCNFSKENRVNK